MITHLWHKTRRNRLATGRKGFSSIIGAIFMVLIVWILASSYFIWTLSQNTLYNQAINEIRQTEADRSCEAIATSHANYTIPQTGTVEVGVTITNAGPVSAQIITAWVVWVAGGETRYGFNDTLNINLNPGQTLQVTIRVTIPDVNSTGTFNGWLATARGNLVPLETEKIVTHAQVALGIGSIMMDLDNFKYYYWNSKTEVLSPSDGIKSTTIILTGDSIVFGVLLSNYDQYHRTIALDNRSLLWLYSPASGAQAAADIVTVVDGKAKKGYYVQESGRIAFRETKWIFFGPISKAALQPLKACAVNLILLGNIDDQDYGQNIPFVSIYVSG